MISAPLLVAALPLVYFAYLLSRSDKLAKFPGPRLAAFSDLWLVWYTYRTRDKEPLRDLHDKYGAVVRIGPNKLSFRDQGAVRDILSVSNDLIKVGLLLAHHVGVLQRLRCSG